MADLTLSPLPLSYYFLQTAPPTAPPIVNPVDKSKPKTQR